MAYSTTAPIWLQVATHIKGDIAAGKLPPGAKLPGGRELAILHSINPNTAARVYQELEKEGLCQTRRGLGTYVTEDAACIDRLREEMAHEAVHRFLTRLHTLGLSKAEGIRMLEEEDENNA